MALQVWLPLTKDLRNQGVSNVTSSGGIIDNNGKLGKCYLVNKTNTMAVTHSIAKTSEWSMCFWAKLPSSMDNATAWEVMFNVPTVNADTGVDSSSNINWASYHAIKIWDDTNHQWYWAYAGTNFNYDQWYHWTITHTANGNGVQGKIYLNGSLINTYNNTTHQLKIRPGTINIGGGISTGGFYINDFRIYDHCLSPLEVKYIAQGLVLHYPLDRNGWGNENLVNNSDFSNLSTTGTVIRDDTVLFHGHSTCKINRTGATANTYTGWTSQNLFSRLTPDTKVTVSVWMYRETTHGIDAGCEWRMYQRYNNDASTDWTGFFSSANWPIGEWKKFTYTYTVRSDISSAYLNFNVVKNGTYWFAEPKIEVGEIATSWTPSSTDALATTMGLNGTTEYDCSGFCNNGTKTGTFTWTSDTPKYQVSTYFEDGSTSYITAPVFMPTDKITTSVWFKGDGSTSGANSYHIPFCIGSGYAEFSVDSSKLYRQGYYINGTRYCDTIGGAIVNDGNWHMMTATYDGTTLCRYLDGQLINSKNISGTLNGGNLTLLIGKYYSGGYNNKKVKQSDVRIYATALSANDVLSLYQNCATIDPDGTIRGQIRS